MSYGPAVWLSHHHATQGKINQKGEGKGSVSEETNILFTTFGECLHTHTDTHRLRTLLPLPHIMFISCLHKHT